MSDTETMSSSTRESAQRLSVLMPVYNESRTLRTIVAQVLAAPIELDVEIVAVDDCSRDDSLHILEELAANDPRIRVVAQPVNRGKGAAIRTAIDHMTGDIAIVQDADLEYDPKDYPKVLAPILDGRADAVYGSRFAASEQRRVLLFWHSLGNRVLTTLSNMANDLNLTDMETCYKAVRTDVLRELRLTSERFGIEPEITARLAAWGARIYEVPISYHGRTYAEGKNIGWRDGVQALWLIFKFRLFDRRFTNREGHTTLESLRMAETVNRWVLEQFDGHIGENVLEAGAGTGNLTSHLIDRPRLAVIDIDRFYTRALAQRFGRLENVEVGEGDLELSQTYDRLGEGKFDTVLCVNVLEHLDHPERALAGFLRALESGGKALLLVPAHQWLFSEADRALEHRKRYEVDDFRRLIEDAGFEVLEVKEFNRLGVLGWWVNKLLGRSGVSRIQARMFATLLPLAKALERSEKLPGLSLVAVAQAPK
jgi:glycosyltransferase involved in cell wall biosynthesis/phospholipid N-methyltransferase